MIIPSASPRLTYTTAAPPRPRPRRRGWAGRRRAAVPSTSPVSLLCPVITIQREPVSAVSSNINFPMKGRRGMKDWARNAEDKLYIPKEVFTAPAEGRRLRSAGTDGCPKLFIYFLYIYICIICIEEVCLFTLICCLFFLDFPFN